MEVVFTVVEMKSSSLTGRKSNANKTADVLPPLDVNKVTAVIGKIAHRFI